MSEKQLRRIAEIQSPTSSFRRAKRHEFNSGQILDLELGDDLLSEPVRQSVLTYLQHERPGLVIIYSFRARPDQLFNLSRSFLEKDHGHMKKHIDHRKKGRRLLEFAVQVGQLCSKLGLKFCCRLPVAPAIMANSLLASFACRLWGRVCPIRFRTSSVT